MYFMQFNNAILSLMRKSLNVYKMFQRAIFGSIERPEWRHQKTILQREYLHIELPNMPNKYHLPTMPTGLLPLPKQNLLPNPMHKQLHRLLINQQLSGVQLRLLSWIFSMHCLHVELHIMHQCYLLWGLWSINDFLKRDMHQYGIGELCAVCEWRNCVYGMWTRVWGYSWRVQFMYGLWCLYWTIHLPFPLPPRLQNIQFCLYTQLLSQSLVLFRSDDIVTFSFILN